MSTQRKLIREGMKQLIEAQVPGLLVCKSLARALDEGQLPAFVIRSSAETVDEDSHESAPHEIARFLSLNVEVITNAGNYGDEIDDALDDLCQAIENAVGTDDTLGGTAIEANYMGYESEINDEGGTLIGTAVVTFQCEYRTVFEGDAANLANFDQAHVTWNLYPFGQHENNRATDNITGIYSSENLLTESGEALLTEDGEELVA